LTDLCILKNVRIAAILLWYQRLDLYYFMWTELRIQDYIRLQLQVGWNRLK
jgi:hypothetical protein